ERLPGLTSTTWNLWADLLDAVEARIFWDDDCAMGGAFLDLPPAQARMRLAMAGIDPDYYVNTPPEPGEKGLIAARQTLARLIGLPVPNDEGLYQALEDLYHDLHVGPVGPGELDAWENHPWVRFVATSKSHWDCGYATWHKRFSRALPAA